MGIIKKQELIKVESKIYICDICSCEANQKHYICKMCQKVLCLNDVVFDHRQMGDYPDRYCQKCWDIGEPYRKKIEDLENEFDIKIDELETYWKDQCETS